MSRISCGLALLAWRILLLALPLAATRPAPMPWCWVGPPPAECSLAAEAVAAPFSQAWRYRRVATSRALFECSLSMLGGRRAYWFLLAVNMSASYLLEAELLFWESRPAPVCSTLALAAPSCHMCLPSPRSCFWCFSTFVIITSGC